MQRILEQIAQKGRVASAYIFLGPPGSGKRSAAEFFADKLGVKKQDRFLLSKDQSSIKIEQVRELQRLVRYGPSVSSHLVVTVEQADTLTDQASAAFLKTLEEPPPGVVFLLLVEREDKILPTIRSRCQKMLFAEKAKTWEKKEDLLSFYEDLENITKKNTNALSLAGSLEKQREKIEELLYELSYFARYKLLNIGYARIILDTLRYIKRKANLRLALDVMCLRLGGENGKPCLPAGGEKISYSAAQI